MQLFRFASPSLAIGLAAACAASAATAQMQPAQGKLRLTGGVSSLDGAAGGGLTPWATVGGYGSAAETGVTAHVTHAKTQDYALTAFGAAVGLRNRLELSLAQQRFNASAAVPGAPLKLTIAGLKLRLAGNAVLDADTLMPQVAAGIQFKHLDPGAAVGAVLESVAAKTQGADFYISATKLLLAHGLLVNGTLRATRANQNGLLGFGSAGHSRYGLQPELSVAKLLSPTLALGLEYRAKPDNLAFAGAAFAEDDWKDIFVAWAPNKQVSFTLAWVDLGPIVGKPRQTGAYLSVQAAH